MICSYLIIWLFSTWACFVIDTVGYEAIIGGDKAKVDQFPYQVSLQIHDSKHICGGGIIGDRFILTAAHCVIRPNDQFRDQCITVLAGTNDLHVESVAMKVEVKKVYVPMEYSPDVSITNTTGDIAVLKLKGALDLSRHINLKRLELPINRHENYSGLVAQISGFGWNGIDLNDTHIVGRHDDQLRFTETNILTNQQCHHNYPLQHISEKTICAQVWQYRAKRGVCRGDNGGPLVYNHSIIGILSRMAPGCNETQLPAIYTRVSHYLEFIEYAVLDNRRSDIRTLALCL